MSRAHKIIRMRCVIRITCIAFLYLLARNAAWATSHIFVRNSEGVWLASDSLVLHNDGKSVTTAHSCKVSNSPKSDVLQCWQLQIVYIVSSLLHLQASHGEEIANHEGPQLNYVGTYCKWCGIRIAMPPQNALRRSSKLINWKRSLLEAIIYIGSYGCMNLLLLPTRQAIEDWYSVAVKIDDTLHSHWDYMRIINTVMTIFV